MYDHEQFRQDMSRPVVFVHPHSREIFLMQLRALSFHFGVFLYWLVASHFLTDMFLYMGAIMWVLGAIATIVLPNERENIVRRTQFFILAYSSMIGFKLFMFFVNNIPLSEWGRALGISLHEAFQMTAINYLSTLFWLLAIGIPFSYAIYLGHMHFVYRSNVDARERTQQILRTGPQRTIQDRRRTRKQYQAMDEIPTPTTPPPPNSHHSRGRRRV